MRGLLVVGPSPGNRRRGRPQRAAEGPPGAVEAPQRHRALHALGFTREIDELMAAAAIAISKPGGLTTSEGLARGAAMIIANPAPGEETRNSDFILENGAGVKVNNLPTFAQAQRGSWTSRPHCSR